MSDPKPNRQLLFVWNYLEWGGAQIYFLGIMKLAKADWDITVLLPEGSDAKLLSFLDTVGVRYEFLKGRFDLGAAPSLRRKLERRLNILRSEINVFNHLRKFDLRSSVLHIEAAPWQSATLLTALSIVRRANIFVTLHNALPDAPVWREFVWKFKIGVVSRLPNIRLFASNKDTKARFRRWVSDKFFQTIKVTYTTVNPTEIDAVRRAITDRALIRKRLGIPADKFVVMCVGQFVDRKGRWIFLEAARSVCEKHREIHFAWLTSSDISSLDKQRISDYGLEDRFHLIDAGKVGSERNDILATYAAADVYALASYVEGLPVALLEAMAMGVASISTNINAIPEAIKHEETGLLIEPGRAGQLADAIIRLYEDAALRDRLARNGRDFVVANFDERSASAIAIAAYGQALAARGR